MNFYETKELGVALAKVLIENGWKVYGLYGDRSDLMTDYYEPAAWDGIAEKNGYVLSFNNRYTQNLDGKMVDNTQTAFGETDESKMVFFPKYQKNPTGSKWHIEKDGEIIAKGRNIGQMYSYSIDRKINGKFEKNDFYGFSEADEKAVANMKKFIEKIEKIVSNEVETVAIKETVEPKSQSTKKQPKKLEVVEGREEVQVDDVLYLSGHHYQVTDIDHGIIWTVKVGSPKNGFQKSQSIYGVKNIDQKTIETAIKKGNLKIYNIVDLEEGEKLMTKEEVIGSEMKKMEQLIDETSNDQPTEEASNDQPTNESGLEQVISEIEKIEDDGINKEVVGSWIWVSGDTWKHKETLKKLGFKWASKKKMWYYTEQTRKRYGRKEYQMDEIKQKYGSRTL